MTDIVERLDRSAPYGLEDFNVLKDAANEIRHLRDVIKQYYHAEYELFQTWDWNDYEAEVHMKVHSAWEKAYKALEEEAKRV